MTPSIKEQAAEFDRKSSTIRGLLGMLRPYADGMEAKGIDCTYMRGKISGLEIALEMLTTTEPALSDSERYILRQFGHPHDPTFNEERLARRVLEMPDTAENWYVASAITLAEAYLRASSGLGPLKASGDQNDA